MKTFRNIGLLLIFTSLCATANAQAKEIREGNRHFRKGFYSEAIKDYKNSLDKKYNNKAQFNLGDAYYNMKNYEEATRSFQSVADRNVPKNMEANAYYNLGNSLMEQQKYAEAFDAYKKSLKIDPKDEDARYNLEYARQKMILQQQQQQQQQNQNQQQDQDKKDDNNKQDQQQQQQNQDNKQEQEQNQDEQQQQQQQQQQEQQMSKEDAERMLQALENQEKETMDKMNEAKAAKMQKRRIQKDW